MAFKDHFRRTANKSDDRKSSISSNSTGKNTNGTITPPDSNTATNGTTKENAPTPLIKTPSRLAKTLSFHTSSNKPSKQEAVKEKKLKEWEKAEKVEWTSPMDQRPGRKDMGCQNTLRAFDFRKAALGGENEGKDRSSSVCSGVSPSASRVGSVDEGLPTLAGKRASTHGVGAGKLSQELRREDLVEAKEVNHMVEVKE